MHGTLQASDERAPAAVAEDIHGTMIECGFPDKRLKLLIGQVFRDLKRMKLNPRHRALAEWLVECTLARGFAWLYAPRLEFIGGPLGLSAQSVSDVLNGYRSDAGPVAGLIELGLVRVSKCALDGGFLVAVMPVVSRWDARVVYSPEQHAAAVAEVDAVRLAFAGQPEFALVAECFPDLARLVDEAVIKQSLSGAHAARAPRCTPGDARPVDVSSHRPSACRGGALARRDGRGAADGRHPVAPCGREDARPAAAPPHKVAGGSVPTEVRKAERPANGGALPKFGNTLKREAKADPKLKNNLKGWRDYSIEQKKEALIELERCADGDRLRKLFEVILGDDVAQHDTGKWIMAVRRGRGAVLKAFTLLIEDMAMARTRCAGRSAAHYGVTYGLWVSRSIKSGNPTLEN